MDVQKSDYLRKKKEYLSRKIRSKKKGGGRIWQLL